MATAASIERTPTDSSAITGIGYDPDARELHIEFPTKHVHVYSNVSPEVHADLMASPSKGGFFGKVIRGGYQSRKLTGVCANCKAVGGKDETCAECGTSRYA